MLLFNVCGETTGRRQKQLTKNTGGVHTMEVRAIHSEAAYRAMLVKADHVIE